MVTTTKILSNIIFPISTNLLYNVAQFSTLLTLIGAAVVYYLSQSDVDAGYVFIMIGHKK